MLRVENSLQTLTAGYIPIGQTDQQSVLKNIASIYVFQSLLNMKTN